MHGGRFSLFGEWIPVFAGMAGHEGPVFERWCEDSHVCWGRRGVEVLWMFVSRCVIPDGAERTIRNPWCMGGGYLDVVNVVENQCGQC